MNIHIKSERLSLVSVLPEHFKAISEYSCDPENARYMVYLPYDSPEACNEYMLSAVYEMEKNSPAFYELAAIYEGTVIGHISLYMNNDRSSAELAWIIHKRYWRNGFACEAAMAVVLFAKEQLNVKSVTAECDDRNVASYALMEKLGLKIYSQGTYRFNKNGDRARERKYILEF